MKTPWFLLLTFANAQPSEEKPIWHADWSTAQRIAKKENKPVFAVFVCQH